MTNKLGKSLLVLGLLLYFLYAVLANVPAKLLASVVHNNLPMVWLNSVEGSVWNGSAAAAQIDVNPSAIPLGKVTWRLSPWSLLTFNPCVDFKANQKGQNISGELCQSANGTTTVSNANLDGSVAIIEALVGAEIKGIVSLEAQKIQFKRDKIIALSAQATWQNARVKVGEEWLSLGSYMFRFTPNQNQGVHAEIANLQPVPIVLAANADWTASDGWTADGSVTPGEGTPQQIRDGLKIFGEETEPGVYKVTWR